MEKKQVKKNPTLKKWWITLTLILPVALLLLLICNIIFWLIWAESGTSAAVIKSFISWILWLLNLLGFLVLIPGIVMRVVWAQKKEITNNKK